MKDPIKKLPQEVQDKLSAYMERIKAIKWFEPTEVNKTKISKQVKFALECFGVKASVEYRDLKTSEDWGAALDAARDAAWDAALGAARGAALDAARDAAWDAALGAARGAALGAALGAARGAARDAAWDAALGAARGAALGAALDAARGAAEITARDLKDFTDRYPNGAFVNLIPLWEMGLYPIGVIGGKFVIYVPKVKKAA